MGERDEGRVRVGSHVLVKPYDVEAWVKCIEVWPEEGYGLVAYVESDAAEVAFHDYRWFRVSVLEVINE